MSFPLLLIQVTELDSLEVKYDLDVIDHRIIYTYFVVDKSDMKIVYGLGRHKT